MDLSSNKYQLVLGSQSPRRQELLRSLDVAFTVRVSNVEEIYPVDLPKADVPAYLANLKLDALLTEAKDDELLICSDTVVLLNNELLEKAANKEEAAEMLRKLSGQTHKVITSVAMASHRKKVVFSDETLVSFKTLTEEEIEYYLENYQPYDKAGSYGVQEWIGMIGITKMEGSYFTVMGFPVHLVYQALKGW